VKQTPSGEVFTVRGARLAECRTVIKFYVFCRRPPRLSAFGPY
jgi:hypothetical protein